MTRERFEKLAQRLEYSGAIDPKAAAREIEIGCRAFGASDRDIEIICTRIEQAALRGVLDGEELRTLKDCTPFIDTALAPEEWALKPPFADSLGAARMRLGFALLDLKSELKSILFRSDKA